VILGIAPCFDDATEYTYRWFKDLVKQLGMQTWFTLEKEEAIRKNVERDFIRHRPEIVVFMNHGVENGLVGNDRKAVIDLKNIGLFRGIVIYTVACLAGKKLGKAHWRNGGVFWGYTEVFGFVPEEEELFKECALSGMIHRVREGKSWEECLKHTKQKFNEAIGKARLLWSRIWLIHDRDALCCFTPSMPPEPECMLRRIAIRLFGRRGWQLRWAHIFFLIGYGIALHDFAHQVWELKGTPISVEGGYVGFGIMLVAILYLGFKKWGV